MARRLRSPRRKEKRARKRKLLFIAVAVFAFFVISGSFYLSWQSFVRINAVSITGAVAVSPDALRAKVEEELRGSYWGVLPRDNFLLYPKESIKEELFNLSGKVKRISVERNSFTSLSVTIEEFAPYALWCSQEEICFFLNSEGLIYDAAPKFTGNVYRTYRGGAVSTNPHGVFLLPLESFKKAEEIFSEFHAVTGLEIVEVRIRDFSEIEGVFSNGVSILFKLSDKKQDILDYLRIALNADAFPGIEEVFYIDLRFGNKVYFKEKRQAD